MWVKPGCCKLHMIKKDTKHEESIENSAQINMTAPNWRKKNFRELSPRWHPLKGYRFSFTKSRIWKQTADRLSQTKPRCSSFYPKAFKIRKLRLGASNRWTTFCAALKGTRQSSHRKNTVHTVDVFLNVVSTLMKNAWKSLRCRKSLILRNGWYLKPCSVQTSLPQPSMTEEASLFDHSSPEPSGHRLHINFELLVISKSTSLKKYVSFWRIFCNPLPERTLLCKQLVDFLEKVITLSGHWHQFSSWGRVTRLNGAKGDPIP